jgi:hypothetical protein
VKYVNIFIDINVNTTESVKYFDRIY